MDWNEYINRLTESGVIKHAAIFSLESQLLAASLNFNIDVDDVKRLLVSFQHSNNSAIFVKTNTIIIINLYEAPNKDREAIRIVNGVADYLRSIDLVSLLVPY
ncbi:hypothetical protein BDF19DRAFT_441509 [Syncephalis fuscata]|nr:hypothetical protein BDF19DRAFT_441509 [Syncephalis fuscata]